MIATRRNIRLFHQSEVLVRVEEAERSLKFWVKSRWRRRILSSNKDGIHQSRRNVLANALSYLR
jgi:hypothetical protein